MAKVRRITLCTLVVLAAVIIVISVAGIVFAEGTSPPPTGPAMNYAGAGTTYTNPSPNLTVDVSSTAKLAQYASATVDGQTVNASFTYPGHWESDGCSSWYVIDDYYHAVVAVQTANLTDGDHTLSVTAKDQNSVISIQQWTFKVNSKPVISAPTPASGGTVSASSGFSVKVTDNDPINTGSIVAKLDGVQVQAAYDAAKGLISYQTTPSLPAGSHTVNVSLADATGNTASYTWSFTVQNTGPQLTFTNEGTRFTTPAPVLFFSLASAIKLDSNVTLTIDGTAVTPTFTYQGHWESDYCSTWYVIDDYTKGTVSVQSGNLRDGAHNITLTAKDTVGNLTTKTGSFSVNSSPMFMAATPFSKEVVSSSSGFSVSIRDNDPINPNSITVKLNGNQVTAAFDPATGMISYRDPAGMPSGTHTVNVSAADVTGNVSDYSWYFTIQSSGPQVTFANEGTTFTTPTPGLSFSVSSAIKLDSNVTLTIDGTAVTATFTYQGHWESDYCSSWYVIDDYTKGTVSVQSGNLRDGAHTITLTAKDIVRNVTVKTGSFSVNSKPVFSAAFPAPDTIVNTSSTFSVKVADNDAINPASITVKLDDVQVPAVFDAATSKITYQNPEGIPDGNHTVNVSAADTSGNVSTYSWSFTIKIAGPGLNFLDADTTYNNYKPTVSVYVYTNIKLSATGNEFKIDGVPVSAVFTYTGHYESDTCSTTWVVDDYNSGTLTAHLELMDGPHSLSVTAKDSIGNTSTQSWDFSVSQSPVLSKLLPAGMALGEKPVVSAVITDPNGPAIDKSSIKLKLDNTLVNATLADSNGSVLVTYAPEKISDDTNHSVSLTAADTAGNSASTSWSFYLATKADMPVTPQDCGSCHVLNANKKYVHSTPPDAGSCDHCHGPGTAEFCGYCHNGDPYAIQNGAVPDPAYGSNTNCTYCHGSDAGFGTVFNRVYTTYPRPNQLPAYYNLTHDIPQQHVINKGTCNDCHSVYLTREHNRKTRDGVQITCITCHKSANPKVQQAVAAKNKDCSACHDKADHEQVHTSDLNISCQNCHNKIQTQEHIDSPKTIGKGYNCETCHASQDKQDKRAIAAAKLNCAACHSEAHDMLLIDTVPPDIPLDDRFQWSDPLEASAFGDQASIPAGYSEGQVVVSERKTVTAQQIWDYYKTQLESKGWSLKSGALAQGEDSFTAEFAKESRGVTIKCLSAVQNADSLNYTDRKIELWYK